MGQTVNLLVYTFGGSNPSSPTYDINSIIAHNNSTRKGGSGRTRFFYYPIDSTSPSPAPSSTAHPHDRASLHLQSYSQGPASSLSNPSINPYKYPFLIPGSISILSLPPKFAKFFSHHRLNFILLKCLNNVRASSRRLFTSSRRLTFLFPAHN